MRSSRVVEPGLFHLLLVAVVACGKGNGLADNSGVLATVVDSAGVTLVLNPREVVSLPIEEARRIGVVEGAEPYQLFRVQTVVEGAQGRVFVGNGTATVRVYSESGEYLTEFGGRGNGPSEFGMINHIFSVGDNVAVVDWQGAGRVALFSPEGALLGNWRGSWGGADFSLPQAYGGEAWYGVSYSQMPDPALRVGARLENTRALRRLVPPPDTLGTVLVELPPRVLYQSAAIDWPDWGLFAAEPRVAVDGMGRLFVAPGPGYVVNVFDGEGRLRRVIRRDYDPVPITEDDVREYERLVEARTSDPEVFEQNGGAEGLRRTLDRIKEQATFPRPESLPPIGDVKVSLEGALWVLRQDTWSPAQVEFERLLYDLYQVPSAPTTWDLTTADGVYRGTVVLPERFRVHSVTGTTVTGVLKDEMDIEYVVTYRVGASR